MTASAARKLRRAAQRQQANIDHSKGPRVIIDVTEPLTDYKGQPIPNPTGGEQTFRDILIDAINTMRPNVEIPTEDKIRSYRLSLLITENDKVELTSEDVTYLKRVTGQNLTPLGAGRCLDLLADPPESRGAVDELDDPDPADKGKKK